MGRLAKVAISLAATLLTSNTFASGGGPSPVGFLTYRADGIVFGYITGTRTGTTPACATFGSGTWFRCVLNCSVYGDTETLQEFTQNGS